MITAIKKKKKKNIDGPVNTMSKGLLTLLLNSDEMYTNWRRSADLIDKENTVLPGLLFIIGVLQCIKIHQKAIKNEIEMRAWKKAACHELLVRFQTDL